METEPVQVTPNCMLQQSEQFLEIAAHIFQIQQEIADQTGSESDSQEFSDNRLGLGRELWLGFSVNSMSAYGSACNACRKSRCTTPSVH
jgi:hypothetical protein